MPKITSNNPTGGVSSPNNPEPVSGVTPTTSGTGHSSVDGVGGSTIAGGLAANKSTHQPGEIIKKLAPETDGKTVEQMSKPHDVSSVSFTYRMGGHDGRLLKPGEEILLEVPPQFRGKPIRFAVLKHRQDASDKSIDAPKDGEYDNAPGVTSLQVHEPETGAWRYWKAPWGSSGSDGGKYAELRGAYDPEVENMFDWIRHGHAAAGGGYGKSHEPLMHDAVRVKSVGKDPVRVHQVDVMVIPGRPDHTTEVIFSPGTQFGDVWTGKGRSYGGGPSKKGTYPEALELSGWGSGGAGAAKLQDHPGWNMENGQLTIDLEPGKIFTGVEIACGDTHPDGKKNKDGHTGTLGWSRLNMGVQRAGSSKVEWFVKDTGVPPEGVLFGGPKQSDYDPQPGDKLVIGAKSDTTYVMGVRLWYNEH